MNDKSAAASTQERMPFHFVTMCHAARRPTRPFSSGHHQTGIEALLETLHLCARTAPYQSTEVPPRHGLKPS